MKKLINDPTDVVADALVGMAAAHPDRLRVDHQRRLVLRSASPTPGKVGVISGGGSGHEPLHAGFVGMGMLDAAACGEVFTSPTPDQILAATEAVDAGAGVLHIVKNYTGDILNFELAAELGMASGIPVASVITADDVAVTDSTFTAGRRGVGVTVFVEKIAGAAAEEGRDLTAVATLAQRVSDNGRSMGLALGGGTVPAAGRPTFDLGENEYEYGIGIHGEPGRERRALAPARELAAALVEPLLDDADFTGAPVLALLNGMGASPLLELYLMYGEVEALLRRANITVARRLVGNYVTSLDMPGCSLTLVRADDEMVRLWDAPVDTPALRWGA